MALLIWLWPITGIILGMSFAAWRYNQVAGWVGLTFVLALGFLAGIVLGPFAICLFLEVRRRDRINKKYHAENGG